MRKWPWTIGWSRRLYNVGWKENREIEGSRDESGRVYEWP